MHNPPHPGLILRDVVLGLKLTVKDAAEQLGVSRVHLSRVLHGRAAISAEMALRIEKWLGTERGGSAETWLRMQLAYDLWQAKKTTRKLLTGIKKVKVPAPNDERYALAA
jgi:antitoxin HigA-1